jgi:hypothetical protein
LVRQHAPDLAGVRLYQVVTPTRTSTCIRVFVLRLATLVLRPSDRSIGPPAAFSSPIPSADHRTVAESCRIGGRQCRVLGRGRSPNSRARFLAPSGWLGLGSAYQRVVEQQTRPKRRPYRSAR